MKKLEKKNGKTLTDGIYLPPYSPRGIDQWLP
jgi:hypothetical protein